ncbi:zonular occludens toxin domain-containing protein [Nanoarchaeota archaeon]
MPKKRKKSKLRYAGKALVLLGKGVYYTGKGGVLAGKFAYKTLKKQKQKSLEKQAEEKRPQVDAQYIPLKEIKTLNGNLIKFENHIFKKDSTIGIILGARGSGKSAIGMKLLENFKNKTKKNIYAIGFKKEDLPNWIKVVENVQQIQNDSTVLIDEGGIAFSSRKSMSNANQLLSELLFIARHKSLSILFITQNSSNLEINVLRQADFLVMKPSSLLQTDFERKIIKEIYQSVGEDFIKLGHFTGLTYIHSDKFQGFITNELPSFWNVKVSKAFK